MIGVCNQCSGTMQEAAKTKRVTGGQAEDHVLHPMNDLVFLDPNIAFSLP